MQNWDIVGLHLRINFYYTMNILNLFWFILLINISLHISLNALILARPRVTLHKNACNHFYILYICDVADASNPTNLKFVKWKCRGCNRKIQWYRKCNILIRQKIKWKRSFFEKKCMFEERIKPQELYEIAKTCF